MMHFNYLRIRLLHLNKGQAEFPMFQCPELTNQTLTIERVSHVLQSV